MKDQHSVLLIGKNGSGKSTVGAALELLQRIARGTNHVDDLVKPKDLSRGRTSVPFRIEIEVDLDPYRCEYSIACELPSGEQELRVLEERFSVDGKPVFDRETGQGLVVTGQSRSGPFTIDRQLIELPLIERSQEDPLYIFKQWLARMLVLRPIPALISGGSRRRTMEPDPAVSDFGAWLSGVLVEFPAAYTRMDHYLRQVMPDLRSIQNRTIGEDAHSLSIQFANDQGSFNVPFADLSDGEKCFMICALVLAANEVSRNLFCFWDEPDNYLALEVQQFVMDLRRAFYSGGQFIATSHNPEAIRSFSNENTLFLHRRSHLEPTIVRRLSELNITGDLVGALARGDVKP